MELATPKVTFAIKNWCFIYIKMFLSNSQTSYGTFKMGSISNFYRSIDSNFFFPQKVTHEPEVQGHDLDSAKFFVHQAIKSYSLSQHLCIWDHDKAVTYWAFFYVLAHYNQKTECILVEIPMPLFTLISLNKIQLTHLRSHIIKDGWCAESKLSINTAALWRPQNIEHWRQKNTTDGPRKK